MTTRLFELLMCPRCGTAPDPGNARCPGCGRSVIAAGGGLDLLDDQGREEADRFAAQYTALRRKEGWIGPDGREDPEGGPAATVARAARVCVPSRRRTIEPLDRGRARGGGRH